MQSCNFYLPESYKSLNMFDWQKCRIMTILLNGISMLMLNNLSKDNIFKQLLIKFRYDFTIDSIKSILQINCGINMD